MCTTSGGGGSASSWAGRMRLNNESIMRSVCFISTQHTYIHNSQIHTIYIFNCIYNWVPIDMWMLRGLSPLCTSPRPHSIPAITIHLFFVCHERSILLENKFEYKFRCRQLHMPQFHRPHYEGRRHAQWHGMTKMKNHYDLRIFIWTGKIIIIVWFSYIEGTLHVWLQCHSLLPD